MAWYNIEYSESFHPKEKLRAEGIRKFSKMQMPNV